MTPPFVSALRTRAEPVRVNATNGDGGWTVRVQCAEVWDAVKVETTPESVVRDVKRAAMAILMPDADAIEQYVVKLRGFVVGDESVSLQRAGATNGSTLLITSIRRRPVR